MRYQKREYKIFLNPQNWDMTENNVKWKSKLVLRAKPGHEKVMALQKPVRILNKKKTRILIPDKFTKGHQISWNLN